MNIDAKINRNQDLVQFTEWIETL